MRGLPGQHFVEDLSGIENLIDPSNLHQIDLDEMEQSDGISSEYRQYYESDTRNPSIIEDQLRKIVNNVIGPSGRRTYGTLKQSINVKNELGNCLVGKQLQLLKKKLRKVKKERELAEKSGANKGQNTQLKVFPEFGASSNIPKEVLTPPNNTASLSNSNSDSSGSRMNLTDMELSSSSNEAEVEKVESKNNEEEAIVANIPTGTTEIQDDSATSLSTHKRSKNKKESAKSRSKTAKKNKNSTKP